MICSQCNSDIEKTKAGFMYGDHKVLWCSDCPSEVEKVKSKTYTLINIVADKLARTLRRIAISISNVSMRIDKWVWSRRNAKDWQDWRIAK